MNMSVDTLPVHGSSRRKFLQIAGGTAIVGGLAALSWRAATSMRRPNAAGYGPLAPANDENTGLALIQLPAGFRYRSFGWTKDPLDDGTPTPGAHDGMAIIRTEGTRAVIVRNHELSGRGKLFGKPESAFDTFGAGGCTTVVFDMATGTHLSSAISLNGTIQNCAGGPTPWGTWLSAEENVGDATTLDTKDKKLVGYTKPHGWVFEVSGGSASAPPKPLVDLGRFVHEAVAIDPRTGIVYLTEDSNPSGFYRMIPHKPGDLARGGKLEMLAVTAREDLRKQVPALAEFSVRWVPIADPTLVHQPNKEDGKGVFAQGAKQGGAMFARLEGVFYHEGRLFVNATTGGDAEQGQVWAYTPGEEKLQLLFESPGKEVLNMPDNLCASPRGCLVMCEDGDRLGQRLQGLTPDGQLFAFAENNAQLNGEKNGFKGDFRALEWSGVCFSPDGKWLFANLQTPGLTLAITGPWDKGPF